MSLNTRPTLEPRRLRALPRLSGVWVLRLFLALFLVGFIVTIWAANLFLTERLTASTRNRAEIRLALYSGTIMSELQRSSVVPLLLSRDPVLITALREGEFTATSQRLISYLDE
ncbi:MAG: sensor histidine kinase, partial [Proteobacteria bacterium]|nr:sensor histidine kinase [Pseudomonadota bacterium]